MRDRLRHAARRRGEVFQYVLTLYGLERLLYRLYQSPHADAFVLKGALLFQLWMDEPHRATRDMDLLGHGSPSADRLEQIFKEVCTADVEPDGLTFLGERVRTERIKEDDEYQGLRVRIDVRLGNARIPLQIDVGFGDVVTPEPVEVVYPTLLDFSPPIIRTYPRETVVAEKLQAMVTLGMANSRMKDFFDIWTLSHRFEFEGTVLCQAVLATFRRRKTDVPSSRPVALSNEFGNSDQKQTQWKAFLRKGNLDTNQMAFADVIQALRAFLMPPLDAARADATFVHRWTPGNGWRTEDSDE